MHEAYIEKCIEGVLMQKTTFPVQVLIHEDASTDNTAFILQKYARKYAPIITCIYQSENQYSKPDRGCFFESIIENTHGKYIAICEGDDYWTDPLKLQKQLAFLESNSDYVLSFHPVKMLEPDGTITADTITKVPHNFETLQDLARFGNYIHTPSVMFKNILNGYPKEFKKSPLGDYFLYMLLARHGKIGKLNDTMAVYRNQTGTWSAQSKTAITFRTSITFSLLQSVFNDDPAISKIMDLRKKQSLRDLDWNILKKEIQHLRKQKDSQEEIDNALVESLQYYQALFIMDGSLKKLLKYTVKKLLKKIFSIQKIYITL